MPETLCYKEGVITDAYGGSQNVLIPIECGLPPGTPPPAPGSLPTTGLDVGLLALGGVVMVCLGIGARRLLHQRGGL